MGLMLDEAVTPDTFTIAEVAERLGLTAHTLRYYERAGLLDPPDRGSNGHRRYTESDLGMLRLLSKLRATGMSIADMRRYADLCRQGPSTFPARRALLITHRAKVVACIEALQDDLKLVDYKIDTYTL